MNLKPVLNKAFTFIPRNFYEKLMENVKDHSLRDFITYSYLQCDLSCRPMLSCLSVENILRGMNIDKSQFSRLITNNQDLQTNNFTMFKYCPSVSDKRKKNIVSLFKFIDDEYSQDFNYLWEFCVMFEFFGSKVLFRYKKMFHFREFVMKCFSLTDEDNLNCYSKIPTSILIDIFKCKLDKDEDQFENILKIHGINQNNVCDVLGTGISDKIFKGVVML